MNSRARRFDVIGNSPRIPPVRRSHIGFWTTGIVVVLVVVLLGAARWVRPNAEEPPSKPSADIASDQSGSAAFEYFPGKYVNQGKYVEEHVQAF